MYSFFFFIFCWQKETDPETFAPSLSTKLLFFKNFMLFFQPLLLYPLPGLLQLLLLAVDVFDPQDI